MTAPGSLFAEAAPSGLQVLNRHHGAVPKRHVYIGRGSYWGNPHTVEALGRDGAVDAYRADLQARYAANDPVLLTALAGLAPAVPLVCSCAPARCHGDSIADLWCRWSNERPRPPAVRAYAGIGSRRTPPEVLGRMRRVAERLDARGYTLRSGGADGADSAFADGATDKEIFLPWRGFNGVESVRTGPTQDASPAASCLGSPLARRAGPTGAQ